MKENITWKRKDKTRKMKCKEIEIEIKRSKVKWLNAIYNYPVKLIDSVFCETLEKIITQTENQNVDDKNVIHLDENYVIHLDVPKLISYFICNILL